MNNNNLKTTGKYNVEVLFFLTLIILQFSRIINFFFALLRKTKRMVFDVNFGHGKRTRRPKSENDVEKRSEDQEPTEVDFALVKIHGLMDWWRLMRGSRRGPRTNRALRGLSSSQRG